MNQIKFAILLGLILGFAHGLSVFVVEGEVYYQHLEGKINLR